MDKSVFISNFRKAFGDYELPVVFWYSEKPLVDSEKTRGCFIKDLKPARLGGSVSLNADMISCGGGKTYTGFITPPNHIPAFVSNKERYKESPELVSDFILNLDMPDILSLAIPMSRFRTMYYTIERSCLTESHAWENVKSRIKGK